MKTQIRSFITVLAAAAALSFTHPASVQAVPITYDYTGNPFNSFSTPPGPYTTSDFVTVMMTFASPLAANMPFGAVTPLAFSLSDGVQTITNVNATGSSFSFATGPSGLPSEWNISADGLLGGIFTSGGGNISPGDNGHLQTGFFFGQVLSNPGIWMVGSQVPDTGSTLLLMTLTLIALGLVARRFQRAAA
jgi:hypothetical protein